MHSPASNPQDLQPAVRKATKRNSPKHKIFITTCETVTAEGHRRGKCFSMKGWQRIVEIFNRTAGKNWTTSQMKNYWRKLREQHKHLFELLWGTGIEYGSGIGKMITSEHCWECKIKENPKYAKYKHVYCREIYNTYGKLFDDTGDLTKNVLPLSKLSRRGFDLDKDIDRDDAELSKLSRRGFDLDKDIDRDDADDRLPMNAERTYSNDGPNEGRGNSSMDIFGRRGGDKRKGKQRREKGKKNGTVLETFWRCSSRWLASKRISPQL